MTWIQNTNPDDHPIRRLSNDVTGGELVEFTDNWKAQVTEEVAAALTDEYEFFERTEDVPDSSGESSDPDAESTNSDGDTEE